jgi:hypothetical protein
MPVVNLLLVVFVTETVVVNGAVVAVFVTETVVVKRIAVVFVNETVVVNGAVKIVFVNEKVNVGPPVVPSGEASALAATGITDEG